MKVEKHPGDLAAVVKILGDKWTPLLILSLADGCQRFCEMQTRSGGVNPRTLSSRLDYLESEGIITRKTYAEVPPRVDYELTAKGKDLIPVLRSMANWGDKYAN